MEEEKLVKWLDAIQSYLDIYGGDGSSFVKSTKQVWIDEMELLSNHKIIQPISFDLEQSSEEFKFMLSRVVLPRLLERFRHVLGNIQNKDIKISYDLNDCSFQSNLNYCFEAGEPVKDIVTTLCALSDFIGRIHHSFYADNKQLTKIQSKESKVFQRLSQSQEVRASKLRILKGIDEDKIISKACDGLSMDIKNAKNDLLIAILEEEEARKAYEKAMAKTKGIRDKISQLESVTSIVENQRSLLLSVTEKCDNEDTVVKKIAENRINLVKTLQNNFQDLWANKIKDIVYSTTTSSFQSLWNQYRATSRLNTFHLRIGREILTLWKKQMTSDNPANLLVLNCLKELENDINNNDRNFSSTDITKYAMEKVNDKFVSSTVVLYNTLDYHETPIDIVESQARTKTAIEIILQQFNKIQQDNVKATDLQSEQRTLALKKCNDVTSVPLYCLPLVHSTQYLHRLYNFSKEAKDEDLYVPLEFDTEWETEVEYYDSDSDNSLEPEVIRGRPPRTMKLRKLEEDKLQSILQHRLPAEKIHQLVNAMNPSRREQRLAAKLSVPSRLSPTEGDEQVDAISSSSRKNRYEVGQRVQTLYGHGVIIADESVSTNPAIHSVLLLWGAKAYLNESCFINNHHSNTTVGSPSLEIKRERGRGHRLSLGKTPKTTKQSRKSSSSSSNDKLVPSAMGNRFDVTDFHLHKLVRRILNIVQLNRFLVENIPMRDAFFSLWLHGRTHGSSNQNFEISIRNWLKKYDPEALHKLLCKYESMLATTKGAVSVSDDFVADFKKLPTDNRRQHLTIYGNEEDLKKSTAELRQEAWDFSCSKILNRRGGSTLKSRARASFTVKKEDQGDDDEENSDDDDAEEAAVTNVHSSSSEPQKKRRRKMKGDDRETSANTDDNNHMDGRKGRGKKRQREKRVVYHNPVLRSDLQPVPDRCYRTKEEQSFNEDIRFLCARLCQKLKLSQTDMVTELVTNFDIQVAQGNISAWIRHKMGLASMYRLSEVIIRWMDVKKTEFLPEDQLLLESVKLRQSTLVIPDGRMKHIARRQKKPRDSTMTSSSQADEINNADRSTLEDSMIDQDDIHDLTGTMEEDSDDSDVNYHSQDEEEPAPDEIDQNSNPASDVEEEVAHNHRETDISDTSSDEAGAVHSLPHQNTHETRAELESDLESETSFYSVRDGMADHETSDKKQAFTVGDSSRSNSNSPQRIKETAMSVDTRMDTDGTQENQDDTMDVDEHVQPADLSYTPEMIHDLLDAFVKEIDRRKLTHAYVEGEAWRMGITIIIQPTVSKFIRTKDSPYMRDKRDLFCNGVAKWLEYSQSRPPPYLKDQAGHDTKDMFCSRCITFTSRQCRSIRDFHEHLAQCGRQATTKRTYTRKEKPSMPVSTGPESDSDEDNDDGEDQDNAEDGRNTQSIICANEGSYFTEISPEDIQKAEENLASHEMDIQMYPYPRGMRYPICGHCGEAIAQGNSHVGPIMSCTSCPGQYHAHCLKNPHMRRKDDENDDDDDDNHWFCPICEQNGAAATIELLPEDVKRTALTPNACIYCFFPEYRSWKVGIFVATHSLQAHLALVRFEHLSTVSAEEDSVDALQWIDLDLSVLRVPRDRYFQSHATRKKRKFSSMSMLHLHHERRPRLRSSFQGPSSSSTNNYNNRNNNNNNNNNNNSNSRADTSLNKNKTHSTPNKRGRPRTIRPTTTTTTTTTPVDSSPSPTAAVHNRVPTTNRVTSTSLADKTSDGMTDTYISATTMQAALTSAGIACQAVDVVLQNADTNAFACIRPPGHHAGRHGCTPGCLSTGFCILNNAALALVYARVTYGLRRVAVVDFDVHFGNGTADILRGDPDAFFASVHMVYGAKNDGHFHPGQEEKIGGFYPAQLGCTDIANNQEDNNYLCIGVQPENISQLMKKKRSWRYKAKATSGGGGGEDTAGVQPSCPKVSLSGNETTGDARVLLAGEKREEDDEEEEEEDDGSDLESMTDIDADVSVVQEEEEGEGEVPAMDVVAHEAAAQGEGVSCSKDAAHAIPKEFVGSRGFLDALKYVVIPKMIAFQPELLIISAGFDGYRTDPIGGALHLSLDDYSECTTMLMNAMKEVSRVSEDPQRESRIVSLLEGGYDTSPVTLGLAKCVERHVTALRNK